MYGVFQVQSSENLQVADLTLEILWDCQVTKTLVPWLLNTERHQTSDKKKIREVNACPPTCCVLKNFRKGIKMK